MHPYRPDEALFLHGSGAPTAFAERPTFYLDRNTGVPYQNLGGSSGWSALGSTLGVPQITPGLAKQFSIERLAYPTLTDTNHVVVTLGANPTVNGTNLVTAYTAAKLLTPGGSAPSATNRAHVVLPIASYLLTTALVLNTNYVDFIAQSPQNPVALGKIPQATDYFEEGSAVPLDFYRPTDTVVYTTTTEIKVLSQTAADVRLMGFTVAQLSSTIPAAGGVEADVQCALRLPPAGTSNAASHYQDMVFFSRAVRWFPSDATTEDGSVTARNSIAGTWVDCTANGSCFRTEKQVADAAPTFSAQMLRVYVGPHAVANISENGIDGGLFIDVHAVGAVDNEPNVAQSGTSAFGEASPIKATTRFINCSAGKRSFGLSPIGAPVGYDFSNYGQYFGCVGDDYSFSSPGAAAESSNNYSTFAGLAVNCTAGIYSFGGGNEYLASFDPGNDGGGLLTGTLIGCVFGLGSAGMADGADVPVGTIAGRMDHCRVTSGSFSTPNYDGGELIACINADGTVVSRRSLQSVSATANITAETVVFTGTTAAQTLTLPAVAGFVGRSRFIKNRSSQTVTIAAASNTIYISAAASDFTVAAGASAALDNDGTYWLKR